MEKVNLSEKLALLPRRTPQAGRRFKNWFFGIRPRPPGFGRVSKTGFWKSAAVPPWLAKLIYLSGGLLDLSGNFPPGAAGLPPEPIANPPLVRSMPKPTIRGGPRPLGGRLGIGLGAAGP